MSDHNKRSGYLSSDTISTNDRYNLTERDPLLEAYRRASSEPHYTDPIPSDAHSPPFSATPKEGDLLPESFPTTTDNTVELSQENTADMEYFFAGRRESTANALYLSYANQEKINYHALDMYLEKEKKNKHQTLSFMRKDSVCSKYSMRRPNLYGETTDKVAFIVLPLLFQSDTPYRFTFYSTAISTVHACFLHEIPPCGTSFSDMLRAGCFWIDILAPTDEEMTALGHVFRIHPLTIEDIMMEEGREKFEVFKSYQFMCIQTYEQERFSPNYLQPFHFSSMLHPMNVRRRIKILKDYINVTPEWITYALIDDVADGFAPIIHTIEFEVDTVDELVLILKESEQSDMLRRIGYCRKKIMGMYRLLGNKTDVLRGLIKRCEDPEVVLYLGDVLDHILTMVQSLSHYEKISSRSHSNYLAQISIDMTISSNVTNDALAKLTALGSVLIPMNLVTGLWGMNVKVPGQERDDLAYFFGLLSFMLLFAVVLTLVLKNLRLL
ncbi:uncharacterized protein VTP21DRAFT_3316 [Calcarisporiella thermophila]|uniref:uncharacterized protein n=1 Tax=Calcarisporiella thermophila TaxID=911321 RepID=UPI003743FC98